MLAPEWTWWAVTPIGLAALALLFVPGTLIALGLRVPRVYALALGPLITTTIVSLAGVAASAAGVPWTPLVAAAVLGSAGLAAWAFKPVAARTRGPRPALDRAMLVHVIGAVTLAAALIVTVIVQASGAPGNFPQNPDMIYHLDLVRWFVDNHTVSSFNTRLGDMSVRIFYPAALHALAATVVMVTGAPAVIALHAVQLVYIAVVWPLGLIALLHALSGWNARGVWIAGLVAASFPIFPFRLIGFGPLWPLDAAYAMIPAWLALVYVTLRHPHARWAGVGHWVLATATLAGLVMLHLAAIFTVALPVWFLLLDETWRRQRARRGVAWLIVRVGVLLSVPAVWIFGFKVAPDSMVWSVRDAGVGWSRALAPAAKWWADGTDWQTWAGWTLAALLIVGGVTQARRGAWWLPTAVAIVWAVCVIGFAQPTDLVRPLTWPWYNYLERIRVAVPVLGAVLVVQALVWLTGRVTRRWLPAVTAVALLVCSLTAAASCLGARVTLANYYGGRAKYPWLTASEADALRVISAALPDDAVVLANPWNGATFLHQVGPENLMITTEKAESEQIDYLAARLDQASTDPQVCSILRQQRVGYLIVGGDPANPKAGRGAFPAFDRATKAPGFERGASAGPFQLYRITACG